MGSDGDGMETDAAGRLYVTDGEHNAVHRRLPDRAWETVVHDPRLLWPDTMSVTAGGYLYVTADQLVGVVLVLRHVHRCGAVVVAGAPGRAWLAEYARV